MSTTPDSLAVRVLNRLAHAVCQRPKLFLYPQILLTALCVFYTVHSLKFTTNRRDLVGADKAYHRNFLAYKNDFRVEDDLVAVVESNDPEKNRQFVERLGARLTLETNLFIDVLYNNDVKMLGNKALLFFPEPDLVQFKQVLGDFRPFLQQFSQATNLESLFRVVNQRFARARRQSEDETQSMVRALPALRRIVTQATDSLSRPGSPPSPGLTALFDAEAERQIYITFAQGRLYLVTARAPSHKVVNDSVRRLRQLVELTRLEVPGVNANITGEPVLEYDEMHQSQSDTTIATVVSLILVLLIFIYGYNESGRPLKATLCLVVGLAYTLAYATLTVGHLNVLTITFVPMLIGLAIDFGVHLVTRYEEEIRHGRSEHEALHKAIVNTGQGIFTGAFTTAGAFFAMGLTDFRGIKEMGIICGGGLLICLVPMMTLLPVLILRGRQNVIDHHQPPADDPRARIERLWLDRPWSVVGCSLALSALCLLWSRNVGFDYNLLNLQARDLPSVELEHKLINSAERSVIYCAVVTDSLSEAVRLQSVVTNLPAVASADSIARFLVEPQDGKLRLVSEIKSTLNGIHFSDPDTTPVSLSELNRALFSLQGFLGLAKDFATRRNADPDLLRELQLLREALGVLRYRMLTGDRSGTALKLAAYQQALFNDVRLTFNTLRNQDDRERMQMDDLPPALRHRFISFDGRRHLIQVYPRKDIWQRSNQVEFVSQLRQALDPNNTFNPVITGTPVQLLEYTTLLKDSYVEAAWYALGAIAILVFIHFRSLTCVLLSLLPVGFGTLWMIGFMGLRDIQFNPANIMTLPLVIGVGVTSGIHILNRFAEEKNPSILAKSTGKAVIVSALTTVAGFGSLVLGKHQGIASLGYVMAIGTTTCMVAAITLLPAVLNLLHHTGWEIKKKPSGETGKLDTGLGGTEAKASIATRT